MSTQISITMGRLIPWLTLPALGGCVVGETALPTSTDRDADGVHTPDDCDDRDPAVYPGAPEVCDGIDNDCSGTPDDNPIDGLLLYTDADADGHGIAPLFYGCSQAEGAIQAGDCNDLDPAIHPGADDTNCDGIDDDCDGLIDGDQWFEGFADRDGDGYGDPDQPTESCDPFAVVPNSDDCDDNDSAIHPAGEEVCGDQVDSDCDGTPGEACGIEDADDPIEVTLQGGGSNTRRSIVGFDLDHDGTEELLVGDETGGAAGLGAVSVLWNEPTLADTTGEDFESTLIARASGPDREASLGRSLTVLDDFTGDGWPDLVVQTGTAFAVVSDALAPGEPDRRLQDVQAWFLKVETGLGAIGSGGDLNGDGRTDLIVARQDGQTVILAGTPEPLSGQLDARATYILPSMQNAASKGKGSAFCGGDLNGDGYAELVLGDTVGDDAGEARVFAGETLSDDTTITDATPITADETSYRTLGRHVAIAGDLNHDGYNDLAVSGIESTTGHPTTFVLPGGIGIFPSINPVPIDAIAIATMTPAGATQLVELVPTGDLTGDGVDDLAILTTAPDGDFAAVYPGTTDGFGSDPRFIPLSLSNDAALASGGVARMRPLDEPLLVLATSSGDLSIYLLPGF